MSLNISSLMDILTILLLFLILNFDSQESTVTAPKDIELPTSKSEALVKLAVKVTVSAEMKPCATVWRPRSASCSPIWSTCDAWVLR